MRNRERVIKRLSLKRRHSIQDQYSMSVAIYVACPFREHSLKSHTKRGYVVYFWVIFFPSLALHIRAFSLPKDRPITSVRDVPIWFRDCVRNAVFFQEKIHIDAQTTRHTINMYVFLPKAFKKLAIMYWKCEVLYCEDGKKKCVGRIPRHHFKAFQYSVEDNLKAFVLRNGAVSNMPPSEKVVKTKKWMQSFSTNGKLEKLFTSGVFFFNEERRAR